jgi:hypothetical protein
VKYTSLLVSNASPIKLAKNPRFHDQTKKVNTQYHLIQYHVEVKNIHLRHCPQRRKLWTSSLKGLEEKKLKNS